MNRDETRALLFIAAAMESRGWTPTQIDVDAWTLVLADLGHFDDARDAIIAHYRQSPHRVTPAEVIAGVKRLRADRLSRIPDPAPDADPDDPLAYRRALREGRTRVADGDIPAQPQRVRAAIANTFREVPAIDPPLAPRNAPNLTGLPPVDPERMAQARAELDAREPVPLPEQQPADDPT